MNPVLTGFLLAIPIYFVILLIYNKIQQAKDQKKQNSKQSNENVLELLKSKEFQDLLAWIRKAITQKASKRSIKKTLKKNGWDEETIAQAINQIKESEKYAKEKTKPKLPSGINAKQRNQLAFKLKGEDGQVATKPTGSNPEDLAESNTKERNITTGIPAGDPRGSERSSSGNGEVEQSRILPLSTVSSSKPDQRKSKWDWRSIKQDR